MMGMGMIKIIIVVNFYYYYVPVSGLSSLHAWFHLSYNNHRKRDHYYYFTDENMDVQCTLSHLSKMQVGLQSILYFRYKNCSPWIRNGGCLNGADEESERPCMACLTHLEFSKQPGNLWDIYACWWDIYGWWGNLPTSIQPMGNRTEQKAPGSRRAAWSELP